VIGLAGTHSKQLGIDIATVLADYFGGWRYAFF
jgi:hypothetical protein